MTELPKNIQVKISRKQSQLDLETLQSIIQNWFLKK